VFGTIFDQPVKKMDRLFLLIILLPFFMGCLCDPENCRYPDLFHPGHISEQQERMKRFDPFTRSDIGPKIAGDRPSGALDQTPPQQKMPK
jgi:hypothetical protein